MVRVTADATAPPPVPMRTKVLYGVGDIANSVKMVLFGLFTIYFYTTVMGLPARLVGIASAIGLFWDALIDPYIGSYSDRCCSSWGRRHPFILAGSLAMGLCMWLFFRPPPDLSTPMLCFWLLATGLLVRTMTSFYGVPYYALGAELSQDYHERTQITGIRSAWALAGTLAAATLPFLLFFSTPAEGSDPKLTYGSYPVMGGAFGAVMSATGLVACFSTWPLRNLRVPHLGLETGSSPRGFFEGFALSMANRSFRILFLSFSLFFLGVVINGSVSIHFLTQYAAIHSSRAISAFQLSFYLGGLCGVLFWTPVSRRFEKRRLYFVSTLFTATVMSAAFLLFGEGHPLGTGNIKALCVGHGLAGFFASILWILPGSMIADVADEDAVATGTRREGTFFGIFFFGQQIAAGLSLLVTGVLAQDFAGLSPGTAVQSAATARRLAMIYSLLPAGLLAVAAFLIVGYRLDRAKVERIQEHLHRGIR